MSRGFFGTLLSGWDDDRFDDLGDRVGKRVSGEESASGQIQMLRGRVDQLTLTVMALWEVLQQKAGVTEAEIVEKIREIDLRDGKADGKFQIGPQVCPKCARTMSARHLRCLYCAAPVRKG